MHSKYARLTHPARLAWIAVVLLASLACNAITNVGSQVNEVRGTAQSIITQAQGIATQGSSVISTAQAFATQNPELVQTARAFATQQGPALLATAQALATQNPGLLQTLQAVATQGFTDGAPSDIPIPPDDQIQNLQTTSNSVTYASALAAESLRDYYLDGMAAQGWTHDPGGSVDSGGVSILKFTKNERVATVTLSFNETSGQTFVAIAVLP